nr:hypothetical protein [Tanacetum cinerariifolium]
VLMIELVMHTEKNDMVFHMEKTGMLILLVEINVGGMTADVVDKLTCSSNGWQLKQVDRKSIHALYEPHLDDIRVVPNMHEVHQRAVKISSKSHGVILPSCKQTYQTHHTACSPSLDLSKTNDFQSSVNHNVYNPSSSMPHVEYAPAVHQQFEFSQPDTRLVVLVFQKDNCKKGLGYNAVPPPHTGLFPPLKSDLSSTGLEELFNEPKTEKSKDKSNEVEPESVRKHSDAPIIKDWVSNDEEEEVKHKKVKPSINRINFVKATIDNNPRGTVKTGEQPKQNTHRKRALTVNAARPINAVDPKRTMNVNTAKPKVAVNATKEKAKHNAVKGKKSRMELYMLSRQHGRMILESVENGLLLWPKVEENGVTRLKIYSELSTTEAIQADCDVKTTNIILQRLSPEVYALVSTHKVAKELWEIIQMLMQG